MDHKEYKRLCKSMGLTVTETAKQLGICRRSLHRRYSGQQLISLEMENSLKYVLIKRSNESANEKLKEALKEIIEIFGWQETFDKYKGYIG